MRTTQSPRELATLARTAVAAGHGGLLTVAGGGSEQVAYLDDDGEPVIVCPAPGRVLNASACLAVPVGERRRVVLGGRLVAVGRHSPAVEELLGLHALCFTDAGDAAPVRLARLAVDAVRLELGPDSFQVTCAAFATAEPDLWAAFAAAVAEHLSEAHADVLVRVAAHHLPYDQVIAAAARRLRRTVIELDVVTPLGASRLDVALSAAGDDPHELCGRLLELARCGPGGVRPAEPRPEDLVAQMIAATPAARICCDPAEELRPRLTRAAAPPSGASTAPRSTAPSRCR